MRKSELLHITFTLVCIAGCASPDEGFTLPQGDAERGKTTFVSLGCIECHSVHDIDLPTSPNAGERLVKLGGEIDYAKSYDALVTGIINPSHRLASGYKPPESAEEPKSPMKVYNDVMTVSQLIDIVTFLQEHYRRIKDPTPYPTYIYLP
jgi:sulfur-oxidizing protein SoxX